MVHDFGCLLLRQVVAEVNHCPAEVVCVDLLAIDGAKAGAHSFGAALLFQELAHVGQKIVDVEFLKLGDGLVKRGVGSRFKRPNVLVVLNAGGHVSCDIALLLQFEVLGLVHACERVGHAFKLGAEVVLLDDLVTAEVVHGLAVAEEDWFAGLHGLSLSLESIVGVAAVNDPLGVVGVASVHGSLLQAGNGRKNVHAVRGATEFQNLFVQVLVRLNSNFLTETDN